MLFVVLWCSAVGEWVVVIFVLSVMRVVGGVPLWVECVFRRVNGVCLLCVCVCCVFVSVVHPVVILSAVFCVICSLLMLCLMLLASGDNMVESYSSIGLVMALYVVMIVSFCFPHVVDVSALSICIVLRAFVVVNGRVLPALANTCFKNESMAVQIFFWNMLYAISRGFDIAYDLFVMDWQFKDIL